MTDEELRVMRSRAEWIADCLKMIASPHQWPGPVLHLKTYPWVDGEVRRFGFIQSDHEPLTVTDKEDGSRRTFASFEEMALVWGVDY